MWMDVSSHGQHYEINDKVRALLKLDAGRRPARSRL
jgi:hypothetical protein